MHNFNTSSDNSEPETELPDFSILKPFNMEPREKVITKTIHSTNVNPRTFGANRGLLISSRPEDFCKKGVL